ncbi:MAG TPA: hypothetical protein VEH62_02030 [Gemmatimonadales bacterium]|nr:hypothetical protein [Gemmatimonadales bacterium]
MVAAEHRPGQPDAAEERQGGRIVRPVARRALGELPRLPEAARAEERLRPDEDRRRGGLLQGEDGGR